MTVGAESPSENAHKLAAILDSDSGYGSVSDDLFSHGWRPDLMDDRPLPGGAGGANPHCRRPIIL